MRQDGASKDGALVRDTMTETCISENEDFVDITAEMGSVGTMGTGY